MKQSRTGLCLFALTLGISGCMTLEQMAPPVDDPLAQVAVQRGMDAAAARRGREIYITDCAKCHTVEPIGRYSQDEWAKILPEMAEESKLSASQLNDLRAYVVSARAFLDLPPPPPVSKRK